jgi:hypothetical protein
MAPLYNMGEHIDAAVAAKKTFATLGFRFSRDSGGKSE